MHGDPGCAGSPTLSVLVRLWSSAMAESCGDAELLRKAVGCWAFITAGLEQPPLAALAAQWPESFLLHINVPLRWLFPPPPGRVAVPGLPCCCHTMLALSACSCRCLASLWPLLWNAGGRRRRSLSPSWWQQLTLGYKALCLQRNCRFNNHGQMLI